MFSVLINRLFTLQIIQGEEHLNSFTLRIIKERDLGTTRGNIYDRYGRPLAVNQLAYSVIIDDSYDVDDKNEMIHELITIIEKNGDNIINDLPIIINEVGEYEFLGNNTRITRFKRDIFGQNIKDEQLEMNAREMLEYMGGDKFFKLAPDRYSKEEALKIIAIRYALYLNRYYKYRPETIAIDINERTLAAIKENSIKFPGVSILQDPIRVYPEGEYFAHIIGYTGSITESQLQQLRLHDETYDQNDIVGQIGIESEMEVYLRGSTGAEKVFVNSLGKTIDVAERIDPVPGKDVYLTIDKQLQVGAYNELEKQLATILARRIVNNKSSNTDLVVSDVFMAFLNNNIISLREIERNVESELQKNIYDKYINKKDSLLNNIERQLKDEARSIMLLNSELRDFTKYVYNHLLSQQVIVISAENRNRDSVYRSFMNESISFKEFLEHAIVSNYIDLERIGLSSNYYNNDEIYNILVDFIISSIRNNRELEKKVYSYLIESHAISNKDMILLIYEQGILEYDEEMIGKVLSNSIMPIDFIKDKILNLEITPKQLALEPYSGSVVVTDVHSGEVLALVSYPSYDNNRLVNGMDNAYWVELNTDLSTPMFHRALQQRTAPGSTFKMISALAGLSEGVIRPNETIRDEGLFTKISPPVSTWAWGRNRTTAGHLNVIDAIAYSCNYFFSEVAFRLSTRESRNYNSALGINYLGKYATMFGLDQRTGIELPEYSPQISNQDAVRSSIGQGTNNFTSAHLTRYMATLANGGTINQLRIIDKIVNPNKTVHEQRETEVHGISEFNEQHLNIIREGMYFVTNGTRRGTAVSLFRGFPVTVAGKTGTAQERVDGLSHALFSGYAPYENPEVAITVVIPNGMSSNEAAIVAREVLRHYFALNNTNEKFSYENTLR